MQLKLQFQQDKIADFKKGNNYSSYTIMIHITINYQIWFRAVPKMLSSIKNRLVEQAGDTDVEEPITYEAFKSAVAYSHTPLTEAEGFMLAHLLTRGVGVGVVMREGGIVDATLLQKIKNGRFLHASR